MTTTAARVDRALAGNPLPSKARALLARVLDELERLRTRVEILEAAQGPPDQADAALLSALAAHVAGTTFTAAAVLRHARLVSPSLRQALLAADLTNSFELGHWLRRMAGGPLDRGVVVTRVRRTRAGLAWTLQMR